MRAPVRIEDFSNAISAKDVTSPPREIGITKPRTPRTKIVYGETFDVSRSPTLEDAGFDAQPPARTYSITVDAGAARRRRPDARIPVGRDGRELAPAGVHQLRRRPRCVGNRRRNAPAVLCPELQIRDAVGRADPAARADADDPTAEREELHRDAGRAPGRRGRSASSADRIQSHGLDVSKALGTKTTGTRVGRRETGRHDSPGDDGTAATTRGRRSSRSPTSASPSRTARRTRSSSSPGSTPARPSPAPTSPSSGSTTACSGGAPPARTASRWRPTRPCESDDWWRFAFIVTAEKDGDAAYVGSDWNEGVQPWDFGSRFNLQEATPLLRGTVFTDRGVYRLGRGDSLQGRAQGEQRGGYSSASRRHTGAALRARQPGSRR